MLQTGVGELCAPQESECNVGRLQELGRVSLEWGDAVLKELAEAEADAESVMITPMVLEMIAERE